MPRKRGELKWLAVDKLRGLTRNPQYLTPRQLSGLKTSIERDGFVAPVLVRPIKGGDYEIVSGNHRVMAARELGYKDVPVIVMKMDHQSARRVAINMNTVHGDPPAELLAPFLAELDDATLADIHLDESLLADCVEFDATLKERLQKLESPEQFDRESPQSPIETCDCPTCGKKHFRAV